MSLWQPLVSVILPVYNGEKYLDEALQSIFNQDYSPIEIIGVDDGSTDGTAQMLAQHSNKVQYYYQPNQGPASARNLGIRMAKGNFITFIDADDLWPDDKLFIQMKCFESFPETEIVQGHVRRIMLSNKLKNKDVQENGGIEFINSNLGAMVIRRAVFDRIGYFNEELTYHSDTDFWLRAREAEIAILLQPNVALIYRIHNENHTTGKDTLSLGFTGVLKRSIDRRRKSSDSHIELPDLPTIPDTD